MLSGYAAWYTLSVNRPPADNSIRCESLLSSRRALCVGAHPDDIEYRAGGLVHVMRKRGIEVIFAIATRGGKGWPGPLRRVLEGMRTRHQLRAGEILGGVEVILYDYPDGDLGRHIEPFSNELRSLISSREPDLILSWDPEFISTPHPDHQAAADAVRVTQTDITTCYYGTTQPNLWVGFDEDSLSAKLRALKAHRTETPWFYFDLWQKKRLLAGLRAEGAKIGHPCAETFRLPSLLRPKA